MLVALLALGFAATAVATPVIADRAAAAVATATGPSPSTVSINSIVYGGTGCPQGSLGSYISADRSTFTLIFDDYVASIGPGVDITESRKNCQLNVDLEYPSGFQYSVFSTVYRGYVGLDADVQGYQGSTYYFSGETAQASTSTTFNGPVSGDYEVVDDIPLASVVWSPCGSPVGLNIDSQVRLSTTSTTATGQITDDSEDGKITFIVGVQWQTC